MCLQTLINHTLCHHISSLTDPCFTSRHSLLSSIGRCFSRSRRRPSSATSSITSLSFNIVASAQPFRCQKEVQQRWSYTPCPDCLATFSNAGICELNAQNTVQEWRRLIGYDGVLKVVREGTDTRPQIRLEREGEVFVVCNNDESVPPSRRALTVNTDKSAKAREKMPPDATADARGNKCPGEACDYNSSDIADRDRVSRNVSTKCIKHHEMGTHSGGEYTWVAEADDRDLSAREASRERNFSDNRKKNGKERKASGKSVRDERSRHREGHQALASTSVKERKVSSNSTRWKRDIEADAERGYSRFDYGCAGLSRNPVVNGFVEVELDENISDKLKKEREIVNMVRAWGDVPAEGKKSRALDTERVKERRSFVREKSFRL